MELRLIRICDLKAGDEFMLHATPRKVVSIADGRVVYYNTVRGWIGSKETVGAKSQQWVDLIVKGRD